MVGYPKHLNTKADYEYVRQHFPKREWAPHWQRLLDTREAWLMVRKLAPAEVGQVDKTHKVIENELPDGTTERYQYEFKEDPQCLLRRHGFTVGEVQAALAAAINLK